MKGILFTVESVIAILMILFIVVFSFQNPPATPEFQNINYKLKVYNGLKFLESTGELRTYTVLNDASTIQNRLQPFIPNFLNYYVTIYNQTDNVTQKPSLANTNEVISISYFLAGDLDYYLPREVRVYLWGFT